MEDPAHTWFHGGEPQCMVEQILSRVRGMSARRRPESHPLVVDPADFISPMSPAFPAQGGNSEPGFGGFSQSVVAEGSSRLAWYTARAMPALRWKLSPVQSSVAWASTPENISLQCPAWEREENTRPNSMLDY